MAWIASLLAHGGIFMMMTKDFDERVITHRAIPLRLLALPSPAPEEIQEIQEIQGHEKQLVEAAAIEQQDNESLQKRSSVIDARELKKIQADYFSVLHAMIDGAKIYPVRALRRRLEGTVVLMVMVNDRGEVLSLKVIKGDAPFAKAAMDAVRDASPFPPLPDELESSLTFEVPLHYRLR